MKDSGPNASVTVHSLTHSLSIRNDKIGRCNKNNVFCM